MKKRPSKATRQARVAPLDHLRPGGAPRTGADDRDARNTSTGSQDGPREGAEPAEPVTPGAGASEAVRGKATRSPAAVSTRRHLEGSEQGPQ